MPKNQEDPTPGKRGENLVGMQLGDYKLTELLAAGGMARVYKGVDVKLGRLAAVKVLAHEMLDTDPTLFERFQREAQAVAALEHDHIITIYQYGEQGDYYFLAMKLIQGGDLAEVMNGLQAQGKLMDPARMLRILGPVAGALDHAHAAGIIHRDVKPSNILLDRNDKAILTDFGLVLRQQIDQTLGTAFGTPRYISPEQAIASGTAVPQSDIYSLAVIVYELVTGSMVFTADTAIQIAISHISEPPPPPRMINPEIPRAVEYEILRALEKDPKLRHETATRFIDALRDAYGDTLTKPFKQPLKLPVSSTPVLSEPLDLKDAKKTAQDGDKTVVFTEARPVKRRRRLPRFIIEVLVMIGMVTAGFVAFNWPNVEREMAAPGPTHSAQTAPTSSPQTAITSEPSEIPVVPPPTETTPPLTGGEPVLLRYNFNVFTLRNEGDAPLDLASLVIVRTDGSNRFNGSSMSGTRLAPGQCVALIVQVLRVEIPDEWGCGSDYYERIMNPASEELFWRAVSTSEFEVRLSDYILVACPAVTRNDSGECTLDWPVVAE